MAFHAVCQQNVIDILNLIDNFDFNGTFYTHMELATLPNLSPAERGEFEDCNQRIESKLGELRTEYRTVHDRKLWREDYPSFEVWSVKRHGIPVSQGYHLVRSVAIKALPTSEAPEDHSEEKRAMTEPPPAPVAPPEPPPTPEAPATPPQPVTPPIPPSAPTPPVFRDRTGYPIPEHRMALYRRGTEIDPLLQKIASVRGAIRRFMEAEKEGRGDPIFRRTNLSDVMSLLDNAYSGIKIAIPFAVCPDCQGQKSDPCLSCKGMGLISEYHWRNNVSEELKTLRRMSVGQ